MNEKRAFENWLAREAKLKHTIGRCVSDTVRSIKGQEDDYDSIDMLLDLLSATVIRTVAEYLASEYRTSHKEGVDGLIDSSPSEGEVAEAVYTVIDGKDFSDRIHEYVDSMCAAALLGEEAELDDAADKVRSKLDTLVETDGHRVRSDARQIAGEELASVGFTVTKTWKTMRDEKVRDTHFWLDGKTIPIDGWFETVNGRALYPGGFGIPEEDCHCRCIIHLEVS